MFKNLISFFRKSENTWIISATVIFFVVAILWLPFGLKRTDIQEGWNLLHVSGEGEWNMTFGRIMVPLPWTVAAFLTPDSFIGAQLILALFFWAKAFSLYVILRLLRLTNHATALLTGILFMIYPADSGLLTLRALSHHSGLFFLLLSVVFLLLYCKSSSKLYFVFMIVTHVISSFTSEAGAVLAFFAPLLILLLPRYPKSKYIAMLAPWYLILVSSLLNYYIYGWSGDYQAMRFEMGFTGNTFIIDVILGNLKAIWFAFILSWWKAIENLRVSWQYFPYALAMTLTAGLGIWGGNRVSMVEGDDISSNNNKLVFVPLAGIAIFTLGFFPFSVTDLRDDTLRVFYYAAMGAAIFWGGVVYLISHKLKKWAPYLFPLISLPLLFLAAVNALDQEAYYYKSSLRQQHILVSIIEQAPDVKPVTVVVLLDDSVASRPFPNERVFSAALIWTYSEVVVTGRVCYENSHNCIFTENGLVYRSIHPTLEYLNKLYPYEDLLIFEYYNDEEVKLLQNISDYLPTSTTKYNPYNRISAYVPFPERPQEAFDSSLSPDPERLSPQDWEGINLTLNDRKVCDISNEGQCALHLQGDGLIPSSFLQKIQINGQAGQTLKLSFWARAEHIVDDVPSPQVKITLFEDEAIAQYVMPLKEVTSDWQIFELKVEAPKPFRSVLLSLESGVGLWSIWIDSLQMYINNIPMSISNSSFEK